MRVRKTLACVGLIALLPVLAGCYIQGGGCNGSLCYGVASDFCDGDDCDIALNQRRVCPDADEIESRALSMLNSARAGGRCGMSSAPGLQWNAAVFAAADVHARDMASNNFVALTGSDGLQVSDRLAAQNVSGAPGWQAVAAGYSRTSDVIDHWLARSGDCAQLLDARYARMALACRADRDSDRSIYWSLVLAGER